jgi:hypothetical protein
VFSAKLPPCLSYLAAILVENKPLTSFSGAALDENASLPPAFDELSPLAIPRRMVVILQGPN